MSNTEVIFVSGQRGSGKSQWVKHYIKSLSRVLVYDTLSEYREVRPRFSDMKELIRHAQSCENSRFLEAAFDPYETDSFDMFCQVALACANIYVVIEELDTYCTPTTIPPNLKRLIMQGRHYGISIIGVSRRPAEVSRHFTSQAGRFIIFHHFEPRDRAYYSSIIGEAAEQIPNLEPHHFLDVDFASNPALEGIIRPPVKIA